MDDDDSEHKLREIQWINFSSGAIHFCPKCGHKILHATECLSIGEGPENILLQIQLHLEKCLAKCDYKLAGPGPKKNFSCKHCSKSFSHKGHYNSHIFYCDPKAQIQDFAAKDSNGGRTSSDAATTINRSKNASSTHSVTTNTTKCSICNKMFSSQRYLEIHALIHTGNYKKITLSRCDYRSVCFQVKDLCPVLIRIAPNLSVIPRR